MRLSKEQKQKYNQFLLDSIDPTAYEEEAITDREKLDFFFRHFLGEVGWNIVRVGELKAMIDYLQGLPSTINIPFENYKILELAKDFGSIAQDASEKEEDKLLENYWSFMANKLIQLDRRVRA